ncbi:Oxidoreductase [Ceratobasidium sp. UAMH 11750]|nr:Oxidoreductase [Ceratobasidium sp. UAMH 11750]
MFAARAAFRSSALRRTIYTARTSNATRSSWVSSGAVLVAGGVTYAAYYSWNIDTRNRRIALDEKAPQKPPTKSTPEPPRKSTDNTSVDAPAPAKPSPGEPGVLKPSGETPTPTAAVGSNPPTDEEEQSEEDKDRAASQGAYNPETGEINWDCPCLGGMAHGPCGPQFREAFSCFVYSNEEPKGVDCVEKFKAMQDCFREHPDVYGEEIDDDGEEEEAEEESAKPGAEQSRFNDESVPTAESKSAGNNKPLASTGVPPSPPSPPPSGTGTPIANISPDTVPKKDGS